MSMEDDFVRLASDRPLKEKLIVYEGWLMKQGGLVPSWKRRLWRLDSWGLLSYYESAGKPPQGHITVADITNIRVTAERSCELVTDQRIYYLYADSMEEMLRFVRAVSLVKDRGAALSEEDLVSLLEDEKVIHELAASDAAAAAAAAKGKGQSTGGAGAAHGKPPGALPPRPAEYTPLAVPKPVEAPTPPPAPPSISATFSSDWSGVKQRAMLTRTLQNWVNYRLKLAGSPSVPDWTTELSSGVFLHTLVKALIPGVNVESFNSDPKRHIEKIQNLNALCLAVRSVRKSFPAVPVQDIVMGRANAGLDLMWDLAFAFEVEDRTFDGKTGVAAVIAWVQSRVADTERELAVTDLTSSFVDGLVFCRLVQSYDPSAIHFSALQPLIREMQHQRLENLNLAFNTAEKLFQVPRLMTAQDFLDNCPDERSVLLYLAIMQGRTGQ